MESSIQDLKIHLEEYGILEKPIVSIIQKKKEEEVKRELQSILVDLKEDLTFLELVESSTMNDIRIEKVLRLIFTNANSQKISNAQKTKILQKILPKIMMEQMQEEYVLTIEQIGMNPVKEIPFLELKTFIFSIIQQDGKSREEVLLAQMMNHMELPSERLLAKIATFLFAKGAVEAGSVNEILSQLFQDEEIKTKYPVLINDILSCQRFHVCNLILLNWIEWFCLNILSKPEEFDSLDHFLRETDVFEENVRLLLSHILTLNEGKNIRTLYFHGRMTQDEMNSEEYNFHKTQFLYIALALIIL